MMMGTSAVMSTIRLPRGYKRLKAACRVPATTANLGPGFDSVGLALTLHNELAAEVGKTNKTVVEITGEGEDVLTRDESNLVVRSMLETFKYLERKPVPVWVRCTNRIPLSRGLGSSSAAVAGGVFLANEICGRPLDREDLFKIAAKIEGHPDNVAPALLGGLAVSVGDIESGFHALSVDLDSLTKWKYVVVIPDFKIDTQAARKVLPKKIPFEDAVFNVGRASLVIAALLKGPGKASNAVLREAMNDRLHQPSREKLIVGRQEVMEAAYKAGALGVCVSGSGPSIFAVGSKWANRIGEAMVEEFQKLGVTARYEVLNVEPAGTISLGVHNF